MNRCRLLWITDPWDTLVHPLDTTLRLMEEAVSLGVETYWADAGSIRWATDRTLVRAFRVAAVQAGRSPDAFGMLACGPLRPTHFRCVIYRPDPPVDLAYLHSLQMLGMDIEARRARDGHCATEILNPPSVLAGSSEKLVAVLTDLMPPTMASAQWEDLQAFGRLEGETIVKPMHLCQSQGVEFLQWHTASAVERSRQALRSLTHEFRQPVVLQRFLSGVYEGETRLWFLDGRLLACARKKPAPGTFRIEMHKGGTLEPHELTDLERQRVPVIGAHLERSGVWLAAVDLIDGWVTDFNVTSPGLLVDTESVLQRNLARPVIEALIRPRPANLTGAQPGEAAIVTRTGVPACDLDELAIDQASAARTGVPGKLALPSRS